MSPGGRCHAATVRDLSAYGFFVETYPERGVFGELSVGDGCGVVSANLSFLQNFLNCRFRPHVSDLRPTLMYPRQGLGTRMIRMRMRQQNAVRGKLGFIQRRLRMDKPIRRAIMRKIGKMNTIESRRKSAAPEESRIMIR